MSLSVPPSYQQSLVLGNTLIENISNLYFLVLSPDSSQKSDTVSIPKQAVRVGR